MARTEIELDIPKTAEERERLRITGGGDLWYASLPDDLKRRCSIHDFKRLGDCFKAAFGIPDTSPPRSTPPAPKAEALVPKAEASDLERARAVVQRIASLPSQRSWNDAVGLIAEALAAVRREAWSQGYDDASKGAAGTWRLQLADDEDRNRRRRLPRLPQARTEGGLRSGR